MINHNTLHTIDEKLRNDILGFFSNNARISFSEIKNEIMANDRVVENINNKFKVSFSREDLLRFSSIDELVKCVKSRIINKHLDNKILSFFLPKTNKKKYYQLSYAQKRIWILNKLEPASPFYNVHVLLKIKGKLDLDLMEKSFKKIVSRHESLRTNFKQINNGPMQIINRMSTSKIDYYNLSMMQKNEKKLKEKNKIVKQYIRKIFNLEADHLCRFAVIRESASCHNLLIVMHHIITDRWSMEIFFKELFSFYRFYVNYETINLFKLPITYKDYAEWENSAAGERLFKEKEK